MFRLLASVYARLFQKGSLRKIFTSQVRIAKKSGAIISKPEIARARRHPRPVGKSKHAGSRLVIASVYEKKLNVTLPSSYCF